MSTSKKDRSSCDDFPVSGGLWPAPDFLINDDLPEIAPDADGLLADLNILMAQLPDGFNFRVPDLKTMNDKAKRQLLIDIQEALGISPLEQLTS